MKSGIILINFGSSKAPVILEILKRLGVSVEVKGWQEAGENEWNDCAALVLSGAPVLLTKTDPLPYIEKFSFLKNSQLPVLGICFGHQLMGMVYGSKVYLGAEVRRKEVVAVLDKSSLFRGFEDAAIFTEDHTEGIELPRDFTLLASSKQYEVEAMKHKSKPHFGVQFHPEVSGEEGERLMGNFLSIVE